MQELAASCLQIYPYQTVRAPHHRDGNTEEGYKNNGRMMPLRKLFDQIPTLLRSSAVYAYEPISVAQYIDPSFPKFDLVILMKRHSFRQARLSVL